MPRLSYSFGRSAFAALVDGLAPRANAGEMPRISMFRFIRASTGAERHEFLMNEYAKKGPLLQMHVLPPKLILLLKLLPKTWSKKVLGYPRRMIFVASGDAMAELHKQTENLERVYRSLGFAKTLGDSSIFMLDDNDQEQGPKWRDAHDRLAPFFLRKENIKSMDHMMREEALWAVSVYGKSPSVRKLADLTSAAIIHRMLFGLRIAVEDFERLEYLAERVWLGQIPLGKAHSAYRLEFEAMMARLQPGITPDSICSQLKNSAADLGAEWHMNQMVGLFFAGQETTRMMLAFALYELVIHPEYQTVFTSDDLPALRTAFLREVLRVHPPVAWLPRTNKAKMTLQGYAISAGSSLQIDVQSMHELRANWGEESHHFQPERFLAPLKKPAAYCPFGFGRRICIGQHMAMFESEAILGEWLKTFAIEKLDEKLPELDYARSGVPSMVAAFKLKFSPRLSAQSRQGRGPSAPLPRNTESPAATADA